ncbi:MAG TPA: hypothetical protein VNN80_07790, partial [Polyangiaceae bacterium]|nr:hypothetical protein [Polyangiaceae bacterium]
MSLAPGGSGVASAAPLGERAAGEGPALACPHAERCPGCPLIGVPYASGLALKSRGIERAVRRHPDLDAVGCCGALAPAPAIESYRLRAKLVTDAAGRLGLFASGSHDVVD